MIGDVDVGVGVHFLPAVKGQVVLDAVDDAGVEEGVRLRQAGLRSRRPFERLDLAAIVVLVVIDVDLLCHGRGGHQQQRHRHPKQRPHENLQMGRGKAPEKGNRGHSTRFRRQARESGCRPGEVGMGYGGIVGTSPQGKLTGSPVSDPV